MEVTFDRTSRGFEIVRFSDTERIACVLQQSSRAGDHQPGASFVWLGSRDHQMHLSRNDVYHLLALLARWVDTGSFQGARPSLLKALPAEQPVASETGIDTSAAAKLAFLEEKGITVGLSKESGKPPRLAYVVREGSEFCDMTLLDKLLEAELEIDRLKKQLNEQS